MSPQELQAASKLTARINKLEEALRRLSSSGTHHDLMPTRQFYPQNEQAMKVDEWWNSYLKSADKTVRDIAKEALKDD